MIELPTESEPVRVVCGDCREVLPTLAADSFDSIACDPPYGLEFMGKEWDSFGKTPTNGFRRSDFPNDVGRESPFGRASARGPEFKAGVPFQNWCYEWAAAALRVLKPGGYAAIFGGTRTYHRLACAVEDAGFEIRDCLMWVYGTGFPKGQGCLKPAWEPILLARKPGKRVLPLGIDACRLEPTGESRERVGEASQERRYTERGGTDFAAKPGVRGGDPAGRYPANVLHDGSDEVMEAFAAFGEKTSGKASADGHHRNQPNGFGTVGEGIYGGGKGLWTEAGPAGHLYGDTGTAARFFYCAKASKSERGKGNTHPTVKPLSLMRWLVRLVTPSGGRLLDPFAGSGTTLLAADAEGMQAVGIEQDAGHCDIIRRRVAEAQGVGRGSLLTQADLLDGAS